MNDSQVSEYSLIEEFAHAASHGAGALLSIGAMIWMLNISIDASDPWRIVSSSVYGASLITLFLASTIYHAFHASPRRHLLKLVDHCAIYFLIAGTATPFLLVTMQTSSRWWLFAAMWSMAAIGVAAKVWLRYQYPRLSLVSYLLMGWLMLVAVPELSAEIGVSGIGWLVAGGLSYTIGAGFFMAKNLKFGHTIWHLFVLAGSIFHFLAVVLHVLPVRNSLAFA